MVNKTVAIIFRWLPVFLWMVLIFAFSSIPGQDIPKVNVPNIDKIAHFLEYLILGFLLIRALLGSNLNISLAKLTILAIIIAVFYGVTDEWHQRFVPNRQCDIFDLFLDFIGVNVGILLYHLNERERDCHR